MCTTRGQSGHGLTEIYVLSFMVFVWVFGLAIIFPAFVYKSKNLISTQSWNSAKYSRLFLLQNFEITEGSNAVIFNLLHKLCTQYLLNITSYQHMQIWRLTATRNNQLSPFGHRSVVFALAEYFLQCNGKHTVVGLY